MSLSFLRMATTSSVIDFTRASGAGCWACATGISNANSKQEEIFMATRSGLLGGFIITFLALPGWIAVVDKMASALQPGIAHEGVFVERCLLNNARGVEKVGTIADRARPVEGVMHGNSVDIEHEIGPRVQQQAETVADRGGTEERQNQIRAAADTPGAQGLSKILVVLLESKLGGEVENAGDPERRIEKKPSEVVYPLLKFALQHVIHRNPDVLEVGKEIRNTGADGSRQHGAVGSRNRLDHRPVRGIVEAEHRPVERLERIGRVAPGSGAASQRSRQEQRRAQPLRLCHAVGFQSLLLAVPFGGFIVQELTDQIFQNDRGLREFQRIAAFQVDGVTARRQADVLLAEQARGHDLGGTVLGKLETAVDIERYHRLEAFVVEMDLADPADDYAGAFHRRADL